MKYRSMAEKLTELGQAKKAYTLQGHARVQGLPISIENRKGSVRKGKNSDGTEWKTKFKHPYGYITGTKGADGDGVDAYVGPDKDAPDAYVVHQHKDDGKGYDEDKVMLGFKNKAEARKAFLEHYDDPKFLGPISEVPVERLKKMVKEKKTLTKISSAAYLYMLDEFSKMASVDVYVDKSDGMDRGVFAERDFKPGEVIEVAPVLVVPRGQVKPEHVLRHYVFNFDEKNVMVALGYASMFNHSYSPNARYDKHKPSRTLTFKAIKPIKAGEEIFVNYNHEPDNKSPLWFDVKEKGQVASMRKEAMRLYHGTPRENNPSIGRWAKEAGTDALTDKTLEMRLKSELPPGVNVHKGNIDAYLPFGAKTVRGRQIKGPVISYRGTDPASLAHEIGHAKTYGQIGRGVVGLRVPFHLMYGGRGRIAALAGIGLSAGHRAEEYDKEYGSNKAKVLALGVPAALAAPTLLDEAVASGRGLAMMRRAGANRGRMLRGGASLAGAYGTYLLPPALVAGTTYAGMRTARVAGDQEKKASQEEPSPYVHMRDSLEKQAGVG